MQTSHARWGRALAAGLLLAGTATFTAGCGGDDTTSAGPGGGGSSSTSSSGTGDAGGTSSAGGQAGHCEPAVGGGYLPTADDISFTAVAPVPGGEQLLFNDWSQPDAIRSMKPDGSGVVEVLRAYRIWSMGVARGGEALAFSCGDPQQNAHYGVNIGDAIQHTWQYDFATESVQLLANGNINDECHHYGPSDSALYLCRRYDFTAEGQFSGYRVGRIDLGGGCFSFLTPDEPQVFTLMPAVSADSSTLHFTRIEINGGTQSRSIWTELPDGSSGATQLRADASGTVLSPGGQRYLYTDTSQASKLYSARLDGSNVHLVVDQSVTSPCFSPDGSRVAYLVWDGANSCSHVEVVAADGSQTTNPTRVRDCAQSGEFITTLAWFVRP